VINQPGLRPGQPGSQITVPLSTLQALQAGQGIPTGQPGHLLVKTETGQYQILRVGPPGQPMVPAAAATPSTVASSPMVMQHQQTAAVARLPSVPSPVQVLRHQMPVTTVVRVPLQPPQQQQAVVRTPTAVVTAAAQAPSPAAAQAK
jgi:transcription initiation factor TFIID subunit 4